jgi:hypothetical protein
MFQDLITTRFGVNRYGGPNFRLIWGQTETYEVATSHGYAPRLMGNNDPCWMLLKWTAPEMYGTPEVYYALTADAETGLAMLGEYPEFGRYEILTKFLRREYNQDTQMLEIHTIPLDWNLIESLIPVMLASQEMTYWEQRAAVEQEQAEENARQLDMIASRLYDDLPSFYGPVSYAGQRTRTALIDRKKEQIEQVWRRRERMLRRQPRRGFYQAAPN